MADITSDQQSSYQAKLFNSKSGKDKYVVQLLTAPAEYTRFIGMKLECDWPRVRYLAVGQISKEGVLSYNPERLTHLLIKAFPKAWAAIQRERASQLEEQIGDDLVASQDDSVDEDPAPTGA